MKKRTKLTLILSVWMISLLAVIIVIYWFFFKPHRDISSAKPDFVTTVADMIEAFEKNDSIAHAMYNNKVIQFTGVVHSLLESDSLVSLMFDPGATFTVTCEMLPNQEEKARNISAGTSVTIKALYVGYLYDAILLEMGEKGDIKLKKGSFVKQ
jgi:flagellar basal body-associated protein FliL